MMDKTTASVSIAIGALSAHNPETIKTYCNAKEGWYMNEEKPKCFTEEELKEMYELTKSCTKYTLKEEDFKEIRKQMEQDGE